MKTSSYKVPDGKLIKIRLDIEDGTLTSISIMGDFFLHPEETIVTIEENLVGIAPSTESITACIDEILNASGAQLIGAEARDIAHAIILALEMD